MDKFKITQLQPNVTASVDENLKCIEAMMNEACAEAPALVCLPEIFCCPYTKKHILANAQSEGGELWQFCSELAKKYGVYLSAGTLPERDGAQLYNTAYFFDPNGRQLAKYRKTHLFDVNVEGGISYTESDIFTPGGELCVFDTELCKIGICVCYDVRFPDLQMKLAKSGAELLLIPASFNLTTGPAHWELLARARALDSQCYLAMTAPACDGSAGYISYGHSIICSPWGEAVSQLGQFRGIATAEIDLGYLKKVRNSIPVLKQRREELYK